MDLAGKRTLPLDRASTWRALHDPAVIKDSIAGCESIEKLAEDDYRLVVKASVGPVRTTLRGRLRLEHHLPMRSYTLHFGGEGTAGFVKAVAEVKLVDVDGGTSLEYVTKAQVGGRLAQVGSRLVDSTARKLADDFFAAFEKRVTQPA